MRGMPALFIGHGSPMNTISDNDFTRAWRSIGEELPRPRAVLVVSAHWRNPVPSTISTDFRRRYRNSSIPRPAIPRLQPRSSKRLHRYGAGSTWTSGA